MVQESGAGASGSRCAPGRAEPGSCRISTSGRALYPAAATAAHFCGPMPHAGTLPLNTHASRVIAPAAAARPSGSGGLGGLDTLRGRFFSAGQADEELGAAFGLVAAGDVTSVVLNDTVDGAEAEAGAPSDRLG